DAEMSIEDKICSKVTYISVKNINDTIELSVGGKGLNWKQFMLTSAYSKLCNCFEWACKKQGYQFKIRKI
ncbi:MAG: hypothetical protein IJA88_02805, partial [Clostridia bacterium]|nr:hypothetical protein [Clostridia bacterium]